MSVPARFSSRARREVAQVLAGFEHPVARRRLRQAFETAARRIGQHPEIGHRQPALAAERYRFWPVAGFPYLLVYLSGTTPPSTARFVHMAQDLPPLLAELRDVTADPPPDER